MASGKERAALQGNDSATNRAHQREVDGRDHWISESTDQRLVSVLLGGQRLCLRPIGSVDPDAPAEYSPQAGPAQGPGAGPRPQSLSQCLLGGTRSNLSQSFRPSQACQSRMKRPATWHGGASLIGELDAANRPVQFGGRSGANQCAIPTPINNGKAALPRSPNL